MKRIGLLIAAAVLLASCQTAMSRDIDLPNEFFTSSVELDADQVEWGAPDHLNIYYNFDEHPNIVRLCIDGVAVMTTTREYGDAVTRVPEWDDDCAQYDPDADTDS